MAQKHKSRPDRELSSFIESQLRPTESARDVVVGNDSSHPIPVEFNVPQNPQIYNLNVIATVQTSQALTDGTKKILIKPRDLSKIELSYDSGFSEFITIPRGSQFEISGIKSSGLTLYFISEKTTVIEIETWI